jgi:hypothetical protein
LYTLRTAAAPLDPRDRGHYLEAVAEAMRDHPNPAGGEFHRLSRHRFSVQARSQRR